MNLQDALKETGKAVCLDLESTVYFIKDNELVYLQNGKEYDSKLTFNESLKYNWQPYREPCRHEPREEGVGDFIVFTPDRHISTKCRCGDTIMPTGWESI